jgi:hypothetical protein
VEKGVGRLFFHGSRALFPQHNETGTYKFLYNLDRISTFSQDL